MDFVRHTQTSKMGNCNVGYRTNHLCNVQRWSPPGMPLFSKEGARYYLAGTGENYTGVGAL